MTMRALITLLFCTAAAAQSVDIRFQTIVPKGKKPGLVLVAEEDLTFIEIEIRGQGVKLKKKFPATKEGKTREIRWTHPPGERMLFGTIRSQIPGGDASVQTVEFESVIATPLNVEIPRDKVDIKGGSLIFTMNHPAGKAEITVRDEEGSIIAEDSAFYDGEKAGTPLSIAWDVTETKAARIDLKAYDKWEFYTGTMIIPWKVEIPHEEVNFRTDSWEIDDSERPKLDASFKLITAEVLKLRRLAGIGLTSGAPPTAAKLYIAGHTDTVDSHEHNDKLSANRAKAIAEYFKKKGLMATIFWAGFGERELLVKTGDNVDERRNRRVEYVVAAHKPGPGNWRKLK